MFAMIRGSACSETEQDARPIDTRPRSAPVQVRLAGRSRLRPDLRAALLRLFETTVLAAFFVHATLATTEGALAEARLVALLPATAAALGLAFSFVTGLNGAGRWRMVVPATLGLAAAAALGAAPGALAALGLGAGAALGLRAIGRLIAARIERRARACGALRQTAVVIGATDAARRFLRRNAEAGAEALDVVALFDDRHGRAPEALEGVPLLGDLAALLDWPELPYVDQIVLAVSTASDARVQALLHRLRPAPNRVLFLLDLERFDAERADVSNAGAAPAALLAGVPDRAAPLKRAFDVVGALAIGLLFLPVIAAVALAVRLDSPGPVLFRQPRVGLNGRSFDILKFRSMRHRPAERGPIQQVRPNDPRVTVLGHILRLTSLDELPQLWNVLKGDMSLVGPRPHVADMRIAEARAESIEARYRHRCRMKPGLTGWAQVNGSRGPLNTADEVRERVRLDLEYCERAGPLFDLKILLRTAPALFGDKQRPR